MTKSKSILSAIRKYNKSLPSELSLRYGAGAYTKGQVNATIESLDLNKDYIEYAYLMYCKDTEFLNEKCPSTQIDEMHEVINIALSGGLLSATFSNFFSTGADGDGFGDGGGD